VDEFTDATSWLTADGIRTRYSVVGDGPPILLFSPGGFDASLDAWQHHDHYRRIGLLDSLRTRYRCIVFDKRESGASGGRLERITWRDYARQAVALLDHLGLDRAHLLGACIGCSVAVTFGLAFPDRVDRIVLWSPAGGPRYRMMQERRFAGHLAYTVDHSLADVVELARSGIRFSADGRVGPWAAALRADESFAEAFAATDRGRYRTLVRGTLRALFDRDTVPGPEPEDLMTLEQRVLIVPGNDASHAPSAAAYLRECLPSSETWDTPPDEQDEAGVRDRLFAFLAG